MLDWEGDAPANDQSNAVFLINKYLISIEFAGCTAFTGSLQNFVVRNCTELLGIVCNCVELCRIA